LPPAIAVAPPRDPFDPWQIENLMTEPRVALGVVLWNNYIYAMGGRGDNPYLNSVEYTVVTSTGSLGTWQTTTSLGKARYALSATASAGRIYAIGGFGWDPFNGESARKDVEMALVQADHSLESWTIATPMTTARARLATVVWKDHIYALGGSHDNMPLHTVEWSTLQLDGSLGTWQSASRMTSAREGLAATIMGDYIYAIGGQYNDSTGPHSLDTIERARINTDGSLDTWQEISKMQVPRFHPAAVISGNYLCVLGGSNESNGGSYLNSVEISAINSDGSLGPWQSAINMNLPRVAFGAVQVQNNLYAVGGSNSTATLASVERTGSPLNAPFLFLPMVLR
jgi:N-acetylneuraminic acid mutarotase